MHINKVVFVTRWHCGRFWSHIEIDRVHHHLIILHPYLYHRWLALPARAALVALVRRTELISLRSQCSNCSPPIDLSLLLIHESSSFPLLLLLLPLPLYNRSLTTSRILGNGAPTNKCQGLLLLLLLLATVLEPCEVSATTATTTTTTAPPPLLLPRRRRRRRNHAASRESHVTDDEALAQR